MTLTKKVKTNIWNVQLIEICFLTTLILILILILRIRMSFHLKN